MGELKSDSEILAEIYRNAQLGLVSIADILPEVDDKCHDVERDKNGHGKRQFRAKHCADDDKGHYYGAYLA